MSQRLLVRETPQVHSLEEHLQAMWPLKWIFLVAFVASAILYDPSRAREGFGFPIEIATLAIVFLLVMRDVLHEIRGQSTRRDRAARAASAVLGCLGLLILGAKFSCVCGGDKRPPMPAVAISGTPNPASSPMSTEWLSRGHSTN